MSTIEIAWMMAAAGMIMFLLCIGSAFYNLYTRALGRVFRIPDWVLVVLVIMGISCIYVGLIIMPDPPTNMQYHLVEIQHQGKDLYALELCQQGKSDCELTIWTYPMNQLSRAEKALTRFQHWLHPGNKTVIIKVVK